jgi:hypothetical protein
MKDRMVLKDELSRAKMPPNVRVNYVPCGHSKQADCKNHYEDTAGIE